MIGDGMHALVKRALAATDTADENFDCAYAKFLEVYSANPTKLTELYPGVAQTLQSLNTAGIPLGLCSNKPQALSITILNRLHIAQYFDVVLGGDVVPHRKPDPRHLLETIRQLDAPATSSFMIGDSENDYNSARAAGVPVILMSYGYLHGPPDSVEPDAWLDRFSDIPGALDRF